MVCHLGYRDAAKLAREWLSCSSIGCLEGIGRGWMRMPMLRYRPNLTVDLEFHKAMAMALVSHAAGPRDATY